MVKRLCHTHGIAEATVIADRGMLTKANLEALREARVHYVVGARLKALKREMQTQVTDPTNYASTSAGASLAEFDHPDGRLIVSRSNKRARRDRRVWILGMWRTRKLLRASSDPKQWLMNRGYARLLRVEGESRLVMNREQFAEQTRWDGLHGVITDLPDAAQALHVLGLYRDRWEVEETFRVTKHDLRARPIFHWTKPRIEAHLAIAFMALLCTRHLQYRLQVRGQAMSPQQINDALSQVQQSVLEERRSLRRYAVPSRLNDAAAKLYRAVGRPQPRRPYEILDRKPKHQGKEN